MKPPFPFRSALRPATVVACLWLVAAGIPARGDDEPGSTDKIPLGATPQQIAALYGPVLRHNARVRRHQILEGGTVIDGDLYGHNGLVIRVVFHGGAAVLLEYTRVAGPLAVRDVNVLLAANAGASTWEAGKDSTDTNRFYHRSDGKALAQFTSDDDGSLLIASESDINDFYGDRLIPGH